MKNLTKNVLAITGALLLWTILNHKNLEESDYIIDETSHSDEDDE